MTLTLDTLDKGAYGTTRFITTVELTGNGSTADIPATVAYRLACYYMLGHLHEVSLRTACHSLWDIYSWQLEQARALPPAEAEIRVIKNNPKVTPVQSRPFIISDE
jgi:hypothetical protein